MSKLCIGHLQLNYLYKLGSDFSSRAMLFDDCIEYAWSSFMTRIKIDNQVLFIFPSYFWAFKTRKFLHNWFTNFSAIIVFWTELEIFIGHEEVENGQNILWNTSFCFGNMLANFSYQFSSSSFRIWKGMTFVFPFLFYHKRRTIRVHFCL